MNKNRIALALLAFATVVPLEEALAVIGRPLTPMSVAGVARRTTRRAVVGTAAVAGTAAVVGTAAVATTAAVAHSHYVRTLPAGCMKTVVGGVVYQNCSGTYYQPVYDGPEVVYQQAAPPPQG